MGVAVRLGPLAVTLARLLKSILGLIQVNATTYLQAEAFEAPQIRQGTACPRYHKISFVKTLNAFALLAAVSSLVVIKEAEARSIKGRIIEGRIAGYECGDNCYLRIVDKNQKEHTGLCTARECRPWNNQGEMPSRFIGKRVLVTVGTGVQIDSSGKERGEMDAFNAIRFLESGGR